MKFWVVGHFGFLLSMDNVLVAHCHTPAFGFSQHSGQANIRLQHSGQSGGLDFRTLGWAINRFTAELRRDKHLAKLCENVRSKFQNPEPLTRMLVFATVSANGQAKFARRSFRGIIYVSTMHKIALTLRACSMIVAGLVSAHSSPFLFTPGTDQLLFLPSNGAQKTPHTNLTYNPPNGSNILFAVVVTAEPGHLTTRNNKSFPACRFQSLDVYLRDQAGIITNVAPPEFAAFAKRSLAPHANCHGFTFARSQFMIAPEDVPTILQQEYEACPETDAEVVVYLGTDDLAIHSALRCKADDGSIFYRQKGGVRKEPPLGQIKTVQQAGEEHAWQVARFYRLKAQ